MGTAIRPSLAALSRSKVLPPDPRDIDRLIQIQRAQNTRDTWDERLAGGLIGALEGVTGTRDFESVPSLRTSRDTGNLLGQLGSSLPEGAFKSIPMMGVAFGAGKGDKTLKTLRRRGQHEVEKVISEGLEKRALGERPMTMDSVQARLKDPSLPREYAPNSPLNEGALSALSIAQQRWPRLFGHLNEIAQPDALLQLKHVATGGIRGAIIPSKNTAEKGHKLAKLALDAEAARPETVGHELLHLKDRILRPHFDAEYAANQATHGYSLMPEEQRARAMGRRMREIVDEIENRGGKARDARGRNIRVRKLSKVYSGDEQVERIPYEDQLWDTGQIIP